MKQAAHRFEILRIFTVKVSLSLIIDFRLLGSRDSGGCPCPEPLPSAQNVPCPRRQYAVAGPVALGVAAGRPAALGVAAACPTAGDETGPVAKAAPHVRR